MTTAVLAVATVVPGAALAQDLCPGFNDAPAQNAALGPVMFDGEFLPGVVQLTVRLTFSPDAGGRQINMVFDRLTPTNNPAFATRSNLNVSQIQRVSGFTPGTYRATASPGGAMDPAIAAMVQFSCQVGGPALTGVTPATALPAGGDTVTITGEDLGAVTQVWIDGVPAPGFQVIDNTHIEVETPPGIDGAVVTVTAEDDLGNVSGGVDYAYASPPPPAVPTLAEWALTALGGVLGVLGVALIRRRRPA